MSLNKVLWEHSHAHLFMLFTGCFHTTTVKLNRDYMACKALNIYCLALYRIRLLTPGVEGRKWFLSFFFFFRSQFCEFGSDTKEGPLGSYLTFLSFNSSIYLNDVIRPALYSYCQGSYYRANISRYLLNVPLDL